MSDFRKKDSNIDGKKVTEIVRDAGAEWKNLDKDEKDRYEKMTEEPTRVYKAEMEEYKRKNSL